jgi:ATP-dependent helicase/nuclease subunit B
MTPRVFNIPASAPFLHTLIRALLDGRLIAGFPASGDPLELARATIYLPTRRACRLARDVFLDATGGRAAILPRLVPIGDIDEDEIVFAQAATGALAEPALGLKPALSALERRLVLATIVSSWAASPATKGAHGAPLVASTPAAALALADDLARLMDDTITRGVSFDALDTLVKQRRDDLEPYWQRSLALLQVVRIKWPEVLDLYGAMEAAARRDRLIDAETERLRASGAPVIAAGSTGSMPSTARLIATIAHLEHGAVVLPGLDTTLDENAWRLLAGDTARDLHDGGMPFFGHPQFALHGLLTRIGIARSDVIELAPTGARETFVSEALRPARRSLRHAKRRGPRQADNDRGRRRRGRGDGCRGGAARGRRASRYDGGADHAGPRPGAPRHCGARTLGRSGR